ncbi:TPA: AlpA family phage regulatory protein [Salmonella enterica]|nr:AlpA family phage regulatory protein [Salmonella enterica]HDC2560396.1 AlpA family phage regulatory protein [Salmonella enterica]
MWMRGWKSRERMLIHTEQKEGVIPARRKLGGRAVGWLLSEVTAWQHSRSKQAPKQAG